MKGATALRVLVFGEDRARRLTVAEGLRARGYAVRMASGAAEASKALAQGDVSAVVITDDAPAAGGAYAWMPQGAQANALPLLHAGNTKDGIGQLVDRVVEQIEKLPGAGLRTGQ